MAKEGTISWGLWMRAAVVLPKSLRFRFMASMAPIPAGCCFRKLAHFEAPILQPRKFDAIRGLRAALQGKKRGGGGFVGLLAMEKLRVLRIFSNVLFSPLQFYPYTPTTSINLIFNLSSKTQCRKILNPSVIFNAVILPVHNQITPASIAAFSSVLHFEIPEIRLSHTGRGVSATPTACSGSLCREIYSTAWDS